MTDKSSIRKIDVIVAVSCVCVLVGNITLLNAAGMSRSKRAICMSNLKRWGQGFEMYANDNDGHFMPGWVGHGWGTEFEWVWYRALEPYVGDSNELMLCPEATQPLDPYGQGTWPDHAAWYIHDGRYGDVDMTAWGYQIGDSGSYGVNRYIYNTPPANSLPRESLWCNPDVQGRNWKRPLAPQAGNVPVLIDATWVGGNPDQSDTPWGDSERCNGIGSFLVDRHEGAVNALFMDWSVRTVPLKNLWTLKWHRQWDTCNEWTTCGGTDPNDWPKWLQ